MEPKFYRWALGLTALALGVMLAFAVWRTPRPPVEVEAVRAACEDVFNTVTVKGTVRARREDRLCVYAPARVETVYAAPGDTVTAGEPLFRVSYTGLDVPTDVAAAVSALFDGADGMAETVDGQVVYAERLCDKVAIIKNGRLIKSGTMEEVKGDSSLENVFLDLEEE